MSNNSFLVEYLNSAVKALKDLPNLPAELKDALEPSFQAVLSSIQDVQAGLHQNLPADKIFEVYGKAAEALEVLKEKIEERATIPEEVRVSLNARYETTKQAFVTFQTKIVDKANVERVLEQLGGWGKMMKEHEKFEELKEMLPWDLYEDAIRYVQVVRTKIGETTVEGLKEPFSAAFTSVQQFYTRMREAVEKHIQDSDLKEKLMGPISESFTIMTAFQERLAKTSALEYAGTALEEVRVQLTYVLDKQRVEDASRFSVQKYEEMIEAVHACQKNLKEYTDKVMTASDEYATEAYAVLIKSLTELQNREFPGVFASQKEYVTDKIRYLLEVVTDIKANASDKLSALNIATAKEVMASVAIAYDTDKVAKLKELLASIKEMELTQAATEKITEAYNQAMSLVASLTAELQGSYDPTKKLVLSYLQKAKENVVVARALSVNAEVILPAINDGLAVIDSARAHALEYASTALEEVRVQLAYVMEQEKVKELTQGATAFGSKKYEEVQVLVQQCQENLKVYAESIAAGQGAEKIHSAYTTVMSNLKELYAIEYTEALASQKEYVKEKVKFVTDAVETTAHQAIEQLSRLNIATAHEVIKSVSIAYNTDKVAKLKDVLGQIQELEVVQGAKAKVSEKMGEALALVDSIKADMAVRQDGTQKLILNYLEKARENLGSAAAISMLATGKREEFVATGYTNIIETAVMVDRRMQLLNMGKYLWEKTKSLDESRLGNKIQDKFLPAGLEYAQSLDSRFTNGKVSGVLKQTKSDFETRRQASEHVSGMVESVGGM